MCVRATKKTRQVLTGLDSLLTGTRQLMNSNTLPPKTEIPVAQKHQRSTEIAFWYISAIF